MGQTRQWISRKIGNVSRVIVAIALAIVTACVGIVYLLNRQWHIEAHPAPLLAQNPTQGEQKKVWTKPDPQTIPHNAFGDDIRYGESLIVNTALYWGPKGKLGYLTNGMNCGNCHLEGGGKLYANPFGNFYSNFPKMSYRRGKWESGMIRIQECIERSLNGRSPDTNGREMKAIMAYMAWVGQGIRRGEKIEGSGSEKLPFLNRAADPARGRSLYRSKCASCHAQDGRGLLAEDRKAYRYPPLWGSHSYNDGAGTYRISTLAGFLKNNMPFGATRDKPLLTNEEAWDLAAFVYSQPRPHKRQEDDWKDLSKKPIDAPFGPYLDSFSESKHKYGPFQPMLTARFKQ